MSGWLLPSLAYIVLLGALGVTTKLALRDVAWHDVILWTALVYVLIGAVLLATGKARFGAGTGDSWAVVSGVLASTALIMFFVALDRGEASRVVPLTSAYPLVTVLLSVVALSEEVTLLRGVAALVVIAGVVMLTVT